MRASWLHYPIKRVADSANSCTKKKESVSFKKKFGSSKIKKKRIKRKKEGKNFYLPKKKKVHKEKKKGQHPAP